jgi:hypothetical protein
MEGIDEMIKFSFRTIGEGENLGDREVDGRILLKKKHDLRTGIGFVWLRKWSQ